MIDANQRWDVDEAIARVRALSRFNLWWIEEPTSPDDVLGHAAIAKGVAPIGVATGEHAANRVIFKQLLQASAISFCQIDSCRLGGVNENLAVILMAAKFGVPLCPHAGGVGLCELVQHLSMFDYVCVSGRMDDRVTEFVDHLHEHFVDPVVIRNAPLSRSGTSRLQQRDARRVDRGVSLSGRTRLAPVRPARRTCELRRYRSELSSRPATRPPAANALPQRIGPLLRWSPLDCFEPEWPAAIPVQLEHEGHGRRPVSDVRGPERGHDAVGRYLPVEVTAGPRGTVAG